MEATKKLSKKDLLNIPCEFAQWVSDKGYEDAFQDVDGDGQTWVNYNDDGYNFMNFEKVKRYSINEIYSYFLMETDRV